jgi:hypothetical protein
MENSFLLLRQFPKMRHLVLPQIVFLLFEYLLRFLQLQIQKLRCSNSMLFPALEIPLDKVRSQLICHLGNDGRILPLICDRLRPQCAGGEPKEFEFHRTRRHVGHREAGAVDSLGTRGQLFAAVDKAMERAQKAGLDLVEISPDAEPPV